VIDHENLWSTPNSFGQEMARECGLDNPQPKMASTPESGEGYFIFQSGNKFYIWDMIQAGVWEILKPNTLDRIIETMVERGEGALKVKELRE
jgi:hypothetical protein